MQKLIAGPWVGEFGWELFAWQGYIRALSRNFEQTTIIARPGAKPIYEVMPGWTDKTFGRTSLDGMPQASRHYIDRLSELVGAPIEIISTGPDREQTISIYSPFGVD